LEALLSALGTAKRDVVRILVSLDAPRAAKAVRRHEEDLVGEPLAPSGGMLIRALRQKSGLTITHVAEQLGVAVSTVSRWESAAAHPSRQAAQALLDLLGATPEERACLDSSGVAKIKADRPQFDANQYAAELEEIDDRLLARDLKGLELRLLQLQSILWWSLPDGQAQELLRRTHALYADLLVKERRYTDAETQAQAVIETSPNPYDTWGIRAQRVVAHIETYRGQTRRPHLGLLTLQRCLAQVSDDQVRAGVLYDMAEFSLVGDRHEEALGYARRSREAAIRACRQTLADAADVLIERIVQARSLLAGAPAELRG
jgi:transcriptional regulator with XRE-family HTH domain